MKRNDASRKGLLPVLTFASSQRSVRWRIFLGSFFLLLWGNGCLAAAQNLALTNIDPVTGTLVFCDVLPVKFLASSAGDSKSEAVGEQRTLVALFYYEDLAQRPITIAQARSLVLGTDRSLDRTIREESYGQAWLNADFLDWMPLGVPVAQQGPADQSRVMAALDLVTDLQAYSRVIVIFNTTASQARLGGISTIGKGLLPANAHVFTLSLSMVWDTRLATMIHEFGHGLGLYHSASTNCVPAHVWIGQGQAGCVLSDTGDRGSWMGYSTDEPLALFSTQDRYRLGWLTATELPVLAHSGVFAIPSLNAMIAGAKGARVPFGATLLADPAQPAQFYWIDYRTTTDDTVQVRTTFNQQEGSFRALRLMGNADPKLGMGRTKDEYIDVQEGRPFHDQLRGIKIDVERFRGNDANRIAQVRVSLSGLTVEGGEPVLFPRSTDPQPRRVQVRNTAARTITFGTARLDDFGVFRIVDDACSLTSIQTGESCHVDLLVAPNQASKIGILWLPNDDDVRPSLAVSLVTDGTTTTSPPAIPCAALSLTRVQAGAAYVAPAQALLLSALVPKEVAAPQVEVLLPWTNQVVPLHIDGTAEYDPTHATTLLKASATVPVDAMEGSVTLVWRTQDDAGCSKTVASSVFITRNTPPFATVAVPYLTAGRVARTIGGPELQSGYITADFSSICCSGSEIAVAGIAVIQSRQADITVSEAGIPASRPMTAAQTFIDVGTITTPTGRIVVNTGVAIANAGTNAASIAVILSDAQGLQITQGTFSLSAGTHVARFIDEFPMLAAGFALPASTATRRSWVLTLRSTQPIWITTLRLTTNQRGDTLLTSMPLAERDLPQNPTRTVFPQLAIGGGFSSALILLNPTTVTQTGRVLFHDQKGQPLIVRQNGTFTSASSATYNIVPGGAWTLDTAPTSADTIVGWAEIAPDATNNYPVGGQIIQRDQDGILVSETGTAAAPASTRAFVFVDRTKNHDTGIAIVNTCTTAACLNNRTSSMTLFAHDLNGTMWTGSLLLNAGEQTARFIGELIPTLPAGFRGVVSVASPTSPTTPFTAMTIRSLINERNEFLFTTFPVGVSGPPLDVQAQRLVFPQFADGPGYQTEIILIPTGGTTTNITVRFFNSKGTPLPVGIPAP